jgi:response regulator RpfG family c-di-GMP phosphodiesterase
LADTQQKNSLLHDAMETMTPAQLLELAIARLTSGNPECALVFALKAVNLAASQHDHDQRRRSLNIASNSCVRSGDYADAIDYGLQSAALARRLHRDDAMVNAFVNVTLALTHIGFFEEAIDIASRIAGRYADQDDCREDVQKLLTNAANACLGAQYYAEVIHYSREAIELNREIGDDDSAYVRLYNEFNWMKAAIALDQPTAVDERFTLIENIANAYPTLDHQHNLRFAKALYRHYAEHATEFALAELEALIALTDGFSPIQVDVLQWAIRLSEEMKDTQRTAHYRRMLVEHGRMKQTARIRRALTATAEALSSVSAKSPAIVEVDVSATKQWIEQLIETPAIDERYPERITARLSLDKQRALERITVGAQVAVDLTGLSIYRIGRLTAHLAETIGYTVQAARTVELAARLHPIGRAAVLCHGRADAVLSSVSAEVTYPEMNADVSEHASLGSEILMTAGHNAFLKLAAEIAQNQYERWNGHGSPRGLAGREIPEAARITTIAIAYDQLTHQGTQTHAEAVQHIKAQAGKQFDPNLVAKFLPMIERLHQQHGDELDRYLAVGAPERIDAKKSYAQLRDLVPGLTLFEDA